MEVQFNIMKREIRDMTKADMIGVLVEKCGYDRKELKGWSKEDLKKTIDEIAGDYD